MTFGQWLRYLRQKAKKTQQALADDTGIPQTTISGWELGGSEPTVSDILKLASALEVSVNKLVIPEDDVCERQVG